MPIILNGSTGISGVDGSAGTPALIGSDADTGFFYTPTGFLGGSSNGAAGRIPSMQIYRLNSNVVGANVTTAQSVLGVGATLQSNTVYAFECSYLFQKSTGATSHTFGIGFGGTASVNNILGQYTSSRTGSVLGNDYLLTTYAVYVTSTANQAVGTATATTSTSQVIFGSGTVSIGTGGTFIPQYTLSAAPGAAYSTIAGSYFRIFPLSESGSNTSIGNWS